MFAWCGQNSKRHVITMMSLVLIPVGCMARMPCLTLELCIARFLLSVIVGEKTQISLFIVHNGSIKVTCSSDGQNSNETSFT